MNWIDIVIIIVAVIGAYMGWKQGLISTIVTILGLIIGVILAGQWSDGLADTLSPSGAQWSYIVAFAIILIIILIIANIVGYVLQMFLGLIMLGWLDHLGGTILGIFTGALVMAAILTSMGLYVERIPGGQESTLVEAIGNSALAELLIDKFRLLLCLLPGEFDSVKAFFN